MYIRFDYFPFLFQFSKKKKKKINRSFIFTRMKKKKKPRNQLFQIPTYVRARTVKLKFHRDEFPSAPQ